MTETNAYGPQNAGDDFLAHPTSTGRAVPIMDLRVTDPTGTVLPIGETGEIWFRGPSLIRGYWNRPDATADTIVDGWLRSGDIGRIDDEGFVYVSDRAKDMVLRGGENIYCAEVEAAIYEHPAVYEAAVYGIPDERLGEELACHVMVKPGAERSTPASCNASSANASPSSRCRPSSRSSTNNSPATRRARSSNGISATPSSPVADTSTAGARRNRPRGPEQHRAHQAGSPEPGQERSSAHRTAPHRTAAPHRPRVSGPQVRGQTETAPPCRKITRLGARSRTGRRHHGSTWAFTGRVTGSRAGARSSGGGPRRPGSPAILHDGHERAIFPKHDRTRLSPCRPLSIARVPRGRPHHPAPDRDRQRGLVRDQGGVVTMLDRGRAAGSSAVATTSLLREAQVWIPDQRRHELVLHCKSGATGVRPAAARSQLSRTGADSLVRPGETVDRS